jgi:putative FmdB family regulatory protein
MPTYEYACPTCGIVEAFQSIKEPPLKKCPQCKKAKVERMVSLNSGVIFKGSGFWETDYNRSADYKKKSADAGAAKDAGKKDGTPAKDAGGGGGKKDEGAKKPAANDTPVPKPQPQPALAPVNPTRTGGPSKK